MAMDEQASGAHVPVVRLRGELDFDVVPLIDGFLRRELGPLYHHRDLVIDLGGATFVDSSFIGFVVALSARQRERRRELALARPSAQVGRALALVGLPNVVPVFGAVGEAVEALARGPRPVIPPPFRPAATARAHTPH